MQAKQDEHTEIPELPPEPELDSPVGDQDLELPPEPTAKARRRRSSSTDYTSDEAPPSPGPDVSVTERQLVKAFYWGYRGWCKLLGAQVEAHHSDFEDIGRAWLDLARKVPGIRWVIAGVGPVFTLTDLLDKLAVAWNARTRLRGEIRIPNWRQRSQRGEEAQMAANGQAPDGGTGAP